MSSLHPDGCAVLTKVKAQWRQGADALSYLKLCMEGKAPALSKSSFE
jgi:hypothetical protein